MLLQAAGEGEEVHSTTLEVSKFIQDPAGSEFKSQRLEFCSEITGISRECSRFAYSECTDH